jgi:hypothetical protein
VIFFNAKFKVVTFVVVLFECRNASTNVPADMFAVASSCPEIQSTGIHNASQGMCGLKYLVIRKWLRFTYVVVM